MDITLVQSVLSDLCQHDTVVFYRLLDQVFESPLKRSLASFLNSRHRLIKELSKTVDRSGVKGREPLPMPSSATPDSHLADGGR